MKKFWSVAAALLIVAASFAQPQDVTKFLGIPVDGSKAEMIQKLKDKGYVYNSELDCLEGEFNGREVRIYVGTNNNKVYRIMIQDAVPSSEGDIKIWFNDLCRQFEANGKYWSPSNYALSEEENISYEMAAHNKRYQAVYCQFDVWGAMREYLSNTGAYPSAAAIMERAMKRSVWFMIRQYDSSRFVIVMFYDNEYNQADGEDL